MIWILAVVLALMLGLIGYQGLKLTMVNRLAIDLAAVLSILFEMLEEGYAEGSTERVTLQSLRCIVRRREV